MSSPFHDLGLRFTGSSSSIAPEGETAHYGGPSPWRGADRSTPDRFRATTDHNRCASIVRAWHDYHLSKGWFGFAYTSAVCPHGHRFEGRGPGKRTGANGTNPGNLRSYAVVYIAGDDDPVTELAKTAFHDEAARLGRPLRWAHSDWKATACPGNPLRAWKAAGWPTGSSSIPSPTPTPAPNPAPVPPPSGGRATVNVSLPILRQGSEGLHVSSLQAELNVKASQGLAVDGDFGPATDRATKNLQRFFGLTVDGIAGPKTWGLLLSIPF